MAWQQKALVFTLCYDNDDDDDGGGGGGGSGGIDDDGGAAAASGGVDDVHKSISFSLCFFFCSFRVEQMRMVRLVPTFNAPYVVQLYATYMPEVCVHVHLAVPNTWCRHVVLVFRNSLRCYFYP